MILAGPERTVLVPGPIRTVLVPGPERTVLVPGPERTVFVQTVPDVCVAALSEANRIIGSFGELAQALTNAYSGASDLLAFGVAMQSIISTYDPGQTDSAEFVRLTDECTGIR